MGIISPMLQMRGREFNSFAKIILKMAVGILKLELFVSKLF